jgi:hypothetical protein
MEKIELLKKYGNSRIRDCAGILHNYTEKDTIECHEQCEIQLRKIWNDKLSDSISKLEGFLKFY